LSSGIEDDGGSGTEDGVGSGTEDDVGSGTDDGVGLGTEDDVGSGTEDDVGLGTEDDVGYGREEARRREGPGVTRCNGEANARGLMNVANILSDVPVEAGVVRGLCTSGVDSMTGVMNGRLPTTPARMSIGLTQVPDALPALRSGKMLAKKS
jgi:hypothetical protein